MHTNTREHENRTKRHITMGIKNNRSRDKHTTKPPAALEQGLAAGTTRARQEEDTQTDTKRSSRTRTQQDHTEAHTKSTDMKASQVATTPAHNRTTRNEISIQHEAPVQPNHSTRQETPAKRPETTATPSTETTTPYSVEA